MIKKILMIGIIISSIIIGSIFFVDYYHTKQLDESAKNNEWVVNCIPGGPDKVVPSIAIENSTHQFDLGDCIWIQK